MIRCSGNKDVDNGMTDSCGDFPEYNILHLNAFFCDLPVSSAEFQR